MPPRLTTCKVSPPAAVLADSLANFADQHAGRGAVQISCSVQAELGFLNDFVPKAAQAKLQQDAVESIFFNVTVEQHVNVATEEPAPSWQAGPPAGEVLGGRSPTPPSRIRSALACLSSALMQCVSGCLRAVLGAFSSGLGCLIGLVKRPGSDNRG